MIVVRTVLFALALAASPAVSLAEDEHPPLPPAVDAFHAIISKDWHAPEGTERLKSACANFQAYVEASGNVANSEAPEKVDAVQWKSAGKALTDGAVALGGSCAWGTDAEVVASLANLHDRFHDVVRLIEGK